MKGNSGSLYGDIKRRHEPLDIPKGGLEDESDDIEDENPFHNADP
jgi:hypothetical protein